MSEKWNYTSDNNTLILCCKKCGFKTNGVYINELFLKPVLQRAEILDCPVCTGKEAGTRFNTEWAVYYDRKLKEAEEIY